MQVTVTGNRGIEYADRMTSVCPNVAVHDQRFAVSAKVAEAMQPLLDAERVQLESRLQCCVGLNASGNSNAITNINGD